MSNPPLFMVCLAFLLKSEVLKLSEVFGSDLDAVSPEKLRAKIEPHIHRVQKGPVAVKDKSPRRACA